MWPIPHLLSLSPSSLIDKQQRRGLRVHGVFSHKKEADICLPLSFM